MRINRFFTLLFFLSVFFGAFADGVWYKLVLKSGYEYECQVEFQNEDVVMFKTVQGKRMQVPAKNVLSLTEIPDVGTKKADRLYVKRLGFLLYMNGGSVWNGENAGWNMGGGLQFGAANLLDRRIFLGAGLGVNAYSTGRTTLFVPLTASMTIPFLLTDDAPFAGLEAGYGFAVKGAQKGGFTGCVRIGWLHRFESQTAMELSLNMSLQQAVLPVVETIEGIDYSYQARRVLPQCGLRIAFLL